MRTGTRAAFAATIVIALCAAGSARADRWHQIAAGDTLSSIAKRYGCSVAEMKKANQLDGSHIRAGERLIVPVCDGPSAAEPTPKRVKVVAGQSIGKPWAGKLTKPATLPPGKGYYIRRDYRAYGTTHMVGYIQRAVAEARRRFPKVHVLAIGDLSQKQGGQISDHHSHQSGRDVDMGLYYKKKPKGYPQDFIDATEDNLDCAATMALLEAFAKTHDKPGGVQMVFMDFNVQGILYKWAKAHGVSEDHLDWLFQYPHGRGASDGLVRHEPNHQDHMHVRFQCAPKDDRCE